MWPTSISFLPPKHSTRNVNSEVFQRWFSARLSGEYPLIVYGNCVSLHRADPARQEVRHRRIQSFFKKCRLPIISYVQTDKNKWFCSVAYSAMAANTFKKSEQINTSGKARQSSSKTLVGFETVWMEQNGVTDGTGSSCVWCNQGVTCSGSFCQTLAVLGTLDVWPQCCRNSNKETVLFISTTFFHTQVCAQTVCVVSVCF